MRIYMRLKMAPPRESNLIEYCIRLVLLIAVLVGKAAGQFVPICGAPGYDIGNLTSRIWTFHLNDDPEACLQEGNSTGDACMFYMAFCQSLDKVMFFNCSDASVCQQNLHDPGAVFRIGGYELNPFKVDTEYNPDGFVVDFPNGGTYHRPNSTDCTLSVRLSFQCFPDAHWIRPPLDTTPGVVPGATPTVFNDTSCQFEVVLQYAGACISILPFIDVTSLSAGTVLVIIFFVTLSAYCIFGAGIKYFKGSRGKGAVPNGGFWVELPIFVSDGFVFVFGGCKSPVAPKGYDDI